MKKCYILFTALLCSYSINAQVGINTDDPKATLDVSKGTDASKPQGIIPPQVTGDELRANAALYGSAQNGAIVYVTAPVTITTEPKTTGITNRGIYIYDAAEPNGTGTGLWQVLPDGPTAPSTNGTGDGAYAVKLNGNINLLSLSAGLFASDFYYLPLSTTTSVIENQIGSSLITNDEYIVPSTGLYQINYSYRTGSGLTAELLSGGTPGVAILKTSTTGTRTRLDYRQFGGVNLLNITVALIPIVVSVSLTQGQISHIYQFQAGESLRFGIVKGGVNLSLLDNRSAEISIFKIK